MDEPMVRHPRLRPTVVPLQPVPSPTAHPNPKPAANLAAPTLRDPLLPSSNKLLSYVDVFVDDFIALAQGPHNRHRVRNILLHAVDQVFRPNDFYDDDFHLEPVSLKKTQARRHIMEHNKDCPRMGHQHLHHDNSPPRAPS